MAAITEIIDRFNYG